MRRRTVIFLALTFILGVVACSADDGEGLPSAPTELRVALAASSGVNLTWKDVSDEEDEYVVERKDAESNSDFSVLAELPADTVEYTDTKVMGGTIYRYRVLAVNGFGEARSDEVLILVP